MRLARHVASRLACGLALGGGVAACDPPPDVVAPVDAALTDRIIDELEPETIALRGSRFLYAEDESPSADEIARSVRALYAEFLGADRTRILAALFEQVTAGAATDGARLLAVSNFLARGTLAEVQRTIATEDGVPVRDPLVHLALGGWTPSTSARLAADLFAAAGYPTRCVVTGGAWLAEVRFEAAWHYIDPATGGARSAVRIDDRIPSWLELLQAPGPLDALPSGVHAGADGRPRAASTPARTAAFVHDDPAGWTYVRKASAPHGHDRTYGWWDLERESVAGMPARTMRERFLPGAVRWRRVAVEESQGTLAATIVWDAVRDDDDDLVGYRVYVSSRARGWGFDGLLAARRVIPYWHDQGGWDPARFEEFLREPPADDGPRFTTDASLRLEWPADEARFVSIMAVDAYHESVGRRRYPLSNELRIDRAARTAAAAPR